jgi:hypothetical protein
MARMAIRVEDKDRLWLKRQARETGISMSEIVRDALCQVRKAESDELLASTSGLWRRGDGLRYQRRIRREWPR